MAAARQLNLASEAALTTWAGAVARAWRELTSGAVLIGLRGELGAGKTCWVRAMLAGLGYRGRVPSPTYTLLEHYVAGGLDVVHLDLYRLGGGAAETGADADLDALGVRDWLAAERCWLLVEWPERAPALHGRCDLVLELRQGASAAGRDLTVTARSELGVPFLASLPAIPESCSS